MVKDAETNAEEDRKRVELTNARNQADGLVHSVNKALTEHGDKIAAEEKTKIEEAVKATEEALKSDDKEKIEAASQALASASQKLGELMYAQAGAAAGADAAAGAAGAAGAAPGGASEAKRPKDDDVVDADFKEVKR